MADAYKANAAPVVTAEALAKAFPEQWQHFKTLWDKMLPESGSDDGYDGYDLRDWVSGDVSFIADRIKRRNMPSLSVADLEKAWLRLRDIVAQQWGLDIGLGYHDRKRGDDYDDVDGVYVIANNYYVINPQLIAIPASAVTTAYFVTWEG